MQSGYFIESAHRAKSDVLALVQLLGHRLRDGATVIGRTLERAARTSWRVEATGALFDSRHVLRSRGYKWDRANSVWWTEVDHCEGEIDWLTGNVLPRWRVPEVRAIDWLTRHR